jgi:serine/threonine protein kinase
LILKTNEIRTYIHGPPSLFTDLKPSNIFILSTSTADCYMTQQPSGNRSTWGSSVHDAHQSSMCLVKIGDFGLAAASEVGGGDGGDDSSSSSSRQPRDAETEEGTVFETESYQEDAAAAEAAGGSRASGNTLLARFRSASRLRAAASCNFLGPRSNSDSLHTSGDGSYLSHCIPQVMVHIYLIAYLR